MNEWLSQQQGSVSKADIQKFLKENRIEVVEVVKNSENIGAIWNDKYEAWETTVDGKPIGDFADTKDEAIRYGKANFGDATKFDKLPAKQWIEKFARGKKPSGQD